MSTIAVTVLLAGRSGAPRVWKLEVPAAEPAKAAAHVFELSNCPPHLLRPSDRDVLARFPCTGLRSVSVGDVLILQDPVRREFRHVVTREETGWLFL